MNIGEKIRQIRKSKGMTQQQLAEGIGVKRAVVSKYETGSIIPSLDTIKEIADALNVLIVELLGTSLAPVTIEETAEGIKVEKGVSILDNKSQLLKAFDNLTEEGQSKVIDYANDITPKYKK